MPERKTETRDGHSGVGDDAGTDAVPSESRFPNEVAVPMEKPVTDLADAAPPTDQEPAHSDTARSTSGRPVRPARRRQLPVLVVAALIAFAADLVSKLIVVTELVDRAPVVIVPRVLDLQLTRNPGAAFGLAGGATVLFTLVALGVVVFIIATARRLRSRGWAVALGLLLGGALGNLGDRLFRDPGPLRGHVVDWIHLSHWPIFNLADTAIVLGGVLAVILSLRGKRLDGTSINDPEPVDVTDAAAGDSSKIRGDEGAA